MINWKKGVNIGALTYAGVCIVSALLLPGWFNFPLDNLLFPVAFIHFLAVWKKRRDLRLLLGSFVALFLVGVISELINHQAIHVSHFLTLLLILKVPVLLTAFLENEVIDFRFKTVETIIDAVFLTLFALNLFMAIDPGGWGYSLQEFYVPKSYTNLVYYNEWGTFRLSGVFSNPNNNALLFAVFFLYYSFFRKHSWQFAALALLLLPLTQSRTVFIALSIVGFLALLSRFDRNHLKKYWYLIPLVGTVVTGIVYSSSNLRSLFNFDAFTSNSLLQRIGNFQKFSEGGSGSLIGGGVIDDPKSTLDIFFDSEFIAVLFQHGILGLIGLFLIFFHLFFGNYMTSLKKEWRSVILLILVASMTNTTFLNGQANVVLGFFLGLMILKDNEISTPRKNPDTDPK